MPETNSNVAVASTSDYYVYGTNLKSKEYFTSTIKTETGIKRYFSNIDAEIYFGDKNITDDICEFRFSVEEKQLPVYSYNKFYPDIIISGQRIVQGMFALNFTNGTYMRDLLSEIDDSVLNTSYFEEELYNPGQIDNNHALWNKSFDIVLGYGDYKADEPSYGSTTQTLCGVKITNLEKGFGTDGKPILDIYTFIAKTFSESDDILNIEEETEEEEIIDDNNDIDDGENNNDEETSSTDPVVVHEVAFLPIVYDEKMKISAILVSNKIDVKDSKYKFSKNLVVEVSTDELYDYYMSKGRGYEKERKYLQSCSNIITLKNYNSSGIGIELSERNAKEMLSSYILENAQKTETIEEIIIEEYGTKNQKFINYSCIIYEKNINGNDINSTAPDKNRPLYSYMFNYFIDNVNKTLSGHIKYSYEYNGEEVEVYEPINIRVDENYIKKKEAEMEQIEEENNKIAEENRTNILTNGLSDSCLNVVAYFVRTSNGESASSKIILEVNPRHEDLIRANDIKYRYSKTAKLIIPDPKIIGNNWNSSNVITLDRRQNKNNVYVYYKIIDEKRPLFRKILEFVNNEEYATKGLTVYGTLEFSTEVQGTFNNETVNKKKDFAINMEIYNKVSIMKYEDTGLDTEWIDRTNIIKNKKECINYD